MVTASNRLITDASVDADLRNVINACRAYHADYQPTLHELAHGVARVVRERDAAWYITNMPTYNTSCEENEEIVRLMFHLLGDAPTRPPGCAAM